MTGPKRLPGGRTSASSLSCWSRIGVRGDRSCPELAVHVHCRNCPVYASGAVEALELDVPVDYLDSWTDHFAKPQAIAEPLTESVLLFRVATEWFGLPAGSVTEVTHVLPVHTLPHQQSAAVLGVVNVRGALVTCLALERLLGIASSPETSAAAKRLLVIRWRQSRAVCPVTDVHGIHRFHPRDLRDIPSTVAKASMVYSTSVLMWRDLSVGILDVDRLCGAMSRSVA